MIFKKTALWLLSALVILLTVLYLIPAFWPFFLAFVLALLIDPVIAKLSRRFSMKRGYASAFTVTLFLSFFLLAVIFIISRLGSLLSNFLNEMPGRFAEIKLPSIDLGSRLGRITNTLPDELADIFRSMISSMRQQAETLPAKIYARVFDLLSGIAAKAPSIAFSLIMFALALYFISAGMPGIKHFILRQLPANLRNRAGMVKSDVLSTIKGWAAAQLKLMGICFLELALAFLIMRLDHAVLLAAGTALVDALPVFGVGLILIPWAVFSLLTGNYRRALLIALTYAIVNLVRSCVEPRLLGKQMGLHPAATLITVYAGYRVSGVSGMILFPIALMLLKQFNDRGWIKLWR